MIAKLRGTIQEINDAFLVVDVGGVGYKVYCLKRECADLANKQEQEIVIYTHYYLRENTAELYGFMKKSEQNMFSILIGISGIGPRGAINILDAAPLDILQRAIAGGDSSILTKVSGIGSRTAQKIILELKDKFVDEWGVAAGDIKGDTDVLEALTTLGYSRAQAQEALRALPDNVEKMEDKLKEALKILGKQ